MKEVVLDYFRLKDEIISFVQNSPEEVNSRVAVFIAGMQAQKSLMNCKQKKDKILFEKTGVKFHGIKTD
jgi:hypothetical protein